MECKADGCKKEAVARGVCPKHYYRLRQHGSLEIETAHDLPPEVRFWKKVARAGPDECWLWTAGRRGGVYGAFTLWPKQVGAHRYSYELHNGPIPDGLVVMHSCDEPLCVNPKHLSLGTSAENSADAARKGRRLPGSQNHQAKLSETQVLAMRDEYATGDITQKQLAARYGVSIALVSFILTRKAWKHI